MLSLGIDGLPCRTTLSAWRAEDGSTVRVAIGSKVYAADQIIGACAGTVFRPSDMASEPVKYVRVCQAARGFARMREVTVDEVRNGGFYALDGCHMGFYSLGLLQVK